MKKSFELTRFALTILLLSIGVVLMVQFEVVERLAYSIEKGQLRARRDALPSQLQINEQQKDTRAVVQTVNPAVVSIVTESVAEPADRQSLEEKIESLRNLFEPESGSDAGPEPGPDRESPDWDEWLENHRERFSRRGSRAGFTVTQNIGSGFVYLAEKGLILTNSHVVDGADLITVTLADGRSANAKVLGTDDDTDLAVIQVDLDRLHQLPFGDSDTVSVGDDVLSVGNPFGLEGTFSKGIISAFSRRRVSVNGRSTSTYLQTDAVINPGSSGGPLVNMRGEVIGVNAAIASHTGTYDGVGFAIPSNLAKGLLKDLVDGGPAFLGVMAGSAAYFSEETAAVHWEERYGAIVTDVLPGLAADQAGLRVNDIVLAINGERIETIGDLGTTVSKYEPGREVQVEIWREDARQTLTVGLGRKYAPR